MAFRSKSHARRWKSHARRSKRHACAALGLAVLIGAGCGAAPAAIKPLANPLASAAIVPLPAPGIVVHLQDAVGITTVGVTGGRWNAPGAVATPDWSTIFTVEAGQLRTRDGVTGAERSSQPVAAGLRPVVSSSDGRFVALTDSPARVGQGVFPDGRTHSSVVVAPSGPAGGSVRTLELSGNVVPEAFSTDHSRLFVIEFLPAIHPDRYRVRSLDIATGQTGPVSKFDKTLDTEEMKGVSRTQVFSAAGQFGPMLYTLYSRADGPAGFGDLHALSLDGGAVHCTDFPASLHIGPAGGAIAVSPDGRRVYVASPEGAVAEIDTFSPWPGLFSIVHTVKIPPGGGSHTVALTADDHTVWVGLGTRLVGLDSTDLHTTTSRTVAQPVHALAVEPSGALYAATAGKLELINPTTGVARTVVTIDSAPIRMAVV